MCRRARLAQRAQVPLEVLPTVPVALQKPPTRTVPPTVAVAAGARVAAGLWCRALAEALSATVAAFLPPPHPVSIDGGAQGDARQDERTIHLVPRFDLVPRLQVPGQGLK